MRKNIIKREDFAGSNVPPETVDRLAASLASRV